MSAFCMLSLWKSKTTAQTCRVSTIHKAVPPLIHFQCCFAAFLLTSIFLRKRSVLSCGGASPKWLSQQETRNSKALQWIPRGARDNYAFVHFILLVTCQNKYICKFAASCPRADEKVLARKHVLPPLPLQHSSRSLGMVAKLEDLISLHFPEFANSLEA